MKIVELTAVQSTVSAFLIPLMEKLHEEGNELYVITSDPEGKLAENPQISRICEKIINLDIPRSVSPMRMLKAYRKLKTIFKEIKPDIVHTHTPAASVISRIAAKKSGIRRIFYTAHGFYFHENMGTLKYKLFFGVEKFLAKKYTDLIFTVNEEDRKTAIDNGFLPAEKIINTNSVGIDTKWKFNPERFDNTAKTKIKKSLGIGDEFVFTFTGRLVREKGVFELVEAYAKLCAGMKNTKLLIIGETLKTDRDKNVRELLEKIVSENEIRDRVLFLGQREDIPELLSITDAFVLPSYREGMPVAPLEAMSMGVPVIGTDIRGMREEIIEGKNGYLIPLKNTEDLVIAMRKIFFEGEKMNLFCQMHAQENFDISSVLKKEIPFFDGTQ